MAKKRKPHEPGFKAKVAIEAVREVFDTNLDELIAQRPPWPTSAGSVGPTDMATETRRVG